MTTIEIPNRIYGVICSMISNREDALDISHDVFLKAHQGLGNFKRASQFYSWLYRIAVNCCIDHMRRQSKRRFFSDEPVSDDVFYHHEVARHLSLPSKTLEHEGIAHVFASRGAGIDAQAKKGIYSPVQ